MVQLTDSERRNIEKALRIIEKESNYRRYDAISATEIAQAVREIRKQLELSTGD